MTTARARSTCRGAVAKHGHDRLDAGAAFGELGADGVPEPVCGDRCFAGRVDQPGGGAGFGNGHVDQQRLGLQLVARHEDRLGLPVGPGVEPPYRIQMQPGCEGVDRAAKLMEVYAPQRLGPVAAVQLHPAQWPDQLRARRCVAQLGEPCHVPVEQTGMRGVGLDYPVLLAPTFTSVANLHEPRPLDAVDRYVRGGLGGSSQNSSKPCAPCVPPTTATMSCDASHAPHQTLADYDRPCRRSLRNEKVRGSSPTIGLGLLGVVPVGLLGLDLVGGDDLAGLEFDDGHGGVVGGGRTRLRSRTLRARPEG